MKYILKRVSFGSKECTEELKLECAYFLGQPSKVAFHKYHQISDVSISLHIYRCYGNRKMPRKKAYIGNWSFGLQFRDQGSNIKNIKIHFGQFSKHLSVEELFCFYFSLSKIKTQMPNSIDNKCRLCGPSL